MKLIYGTSQLVKRVRAFMRNMADLGHFTRLLLIASLVGILTVPAISASEQTDNQAVLTQYMHTFQMDGWHIELVMVDKKFLDTIMKDGHAVAASQLNYNTKTGVVWILRRSEYGPKMFESIGMKPQDDEWVIVDQRNSVVHELIHMVWRYCGNEEQCVAMLAEAIIPHEETN